MQQPKKKFFSFVNFFSISLVLHKFPEFFLKLLKLIIKDQKRSRSNRFLTLVQANCLCLSKTWMKSEIKQKLFVKIHERVLTTFFSQPAKCAQDNVTKLNSVSQKHELISLESNNNKQYVNLGLLSVSRFF